MEGLARLGRKEGGLTLVTIDMHKLQSTIVRSCSHSGASSSFGSSPWLNVSRKYGASSRSERGESINRPEEWSESQPVRHKKSCRKYRDRHAWGKGGPEAYRSRGSS